MSKRFDFNDSSDVYCFLDEVEGRGLRKGKYCPEAFIDDLVKLYRTVKREKRDTHIRGVCENLRLKETIESLEKYNDRIMAELLQLKLDENDAIKGIDSQLKVEISPTFHEHDGSKKSEAYLVNNEAFLYDWDPEGEDNCYTVGLDSVPETVEEINSLILCLITFRDIKASRRMYK